MRLTPVHIHDEQRQPAKCAGLGTAGRAGNSRVMAFAAAVPLAKGCMR